MDDSAEATRAADVTPGRKKLAPLTYEEAVHLPALNGPDVIKRLFQIGSAQFHRRDSLGEFDFLKVKPSVGPKRFSGELIRRYLANEPLYEPTFGRRRPR